MDSLVNKSLVRHLFSRQHLHGGHSDGDEELNCGSGGGADDQLSLRVAAIFVILVGSTLGAVFPIMARKWTALAVPKSVFNFAKYFGSGIILATGFIHLLLPALEALESECLAEGWHEYPYALALCMLSIFMIFLVELLAYRWGTAKLAAAGASYDAHGHQTGALASHGPETQDAENLKSTSSPTLEGDIDDYNWRRDDSGLTQIIGLAILEFGVVLHSILIGLALAVAENLAILLVVIVFHQTFEGLGLGSRLAYLDLPKKYRHVPILAAILYGITTPIGIAVGLGVRSTYNPGSTTASMVAGILDAISAGILIYTALVELLAHDFLFNKKMKTASTWHVVYAVSCMALGVALMSLLGKWA